MLGPFINLPISTLQISPIGLVPKPEDYWRLITILSYPPDYSINSFIEDTFCKVKYSSLDAIREIDAVIGLIIQ